MSRKRVLVSTCNTAGSIRPKWVEQNSDRYDITFNRVASGDEPMRAQAMHPRLRSKMYKMLAWESHPGYDYYIWVDNIFHIQSDTAIECMVDYCSDVDVCFWPHPGRTSVKREVDFILDRIQAGCGTLTGKCGDEPMREQVEEYYKDTDWPDDILIAAGCFVFSKDVVRNKEYNLMKEWFYHNCLWSIRDQLSLPYLLYVFKTNFKYFEGNIYENKYISASGNFKL